MQIIEVNNKTVANLLKKSVAEYWLEDKDAWLKFEDGSVVCIHVIEPSWETYVNLETLESTSSPSFVDSTDHNLCFSHKHEESVFTARTVSICFGRLRYYICDRLKYVTRTYTPVIKLHYYEKEEGIGSHNS